MTTMSHLTGAQVRQQFIEFFEQRAGHKFVPSSPVVPHDDPTLLFTNAGMNQFKPVFLGQLDPGSPLAAVKRAVNSQKCIRAGGKHNDLDDVGKDTFHHTFFEMLGNWSFGDYFKAESIQWAWELLTDIWGVDPDRLYATYFEGDKSLGLEPDREAYELWLNYLPAERVLPGDTKDNFWEMGDTGPCGPCSEIHYDSRPEKERAKTPGYTLVNRDDPDVIEVWNLVFIQMNRLDVSTLEPLPAKHVDTGMGLERIARVLQGKRSNYDTDIFTPLFDRIRAVTGAPEYTGSLTEPVDTAYRVLADHARTLTFAITDGAEPSNEGRGYVLRRVLRRAVRYGYQTLGVNEPFVDQLIPTVVEIMGEAFPEIKEKQDRVREIVRDEEEAFRRTLESGIKQFEEAATSAGNHFRDQTTGSPQGDQDPRTFIRWYAKQYLGFDSGYVDSRGVDWREFKGVGRPIVPAEAAFKLHDTYGFPVDLTVLMAEERGMTVDVAGFERLMEEARERSRQGSGTKGGGSLILPGSAVAALNKWNVKPTDDSHKYGTQSVRARLRAIWNGADFDENITSSAARPTSKFALVFDRTNFYAEKGGQVADTGRINSAEGEFVVEDVQESGGYVLHIGHLHRGEIRVGNEYELRVDRQRRKAIRANHTATHLLNLALRNAIGQNADQKGSLVAPDRLRFDFAASKGLTRDATAQVERDVRETIEKDLPVHADIAPLEDAKRISSLRAVFGEVYPDPVRVVSIGPTVEDVLNDPTSERWGGYSIEFCGGTHLDRTSEAGAFALLSEEGVAKGVRRVVAVTGEEASGAIDEAKKLAERFDSAEKLDGDDLAKETAELTKTLEEVTIPLTDRAKLREQLESLRGKVKKAEKAASSAGREKAVETARGLSPEPDMPAVIARIDNGADRDAILAAMDAVRARNESSAAMLLSVDPEAGKVTIVAKVPEELIKRGLKAGDWVRTAAHACGGKGGGKPDSAQGGGTEPDKADDALQAARDFAKQTLA